MSRRVALAVVGAGAAVTSIGVGLAWLPAGFVVAGLSIAALGLLADYKR